MRGKHTLSFYYYAADADEIEDKVFQLADENSIGISYFEHERISHNIKVKFTEVITEEFKDCFKRAIKGGAS